MQHLLSVFKQSSVLKLSTTVIPFSFSFLRSVFEKLWDRGINLRLGSDRGSSFLNRSIDESIQFFDSIPNNILVEDAHHVSAEVKFEIFRQL